MRIAVTEENSSGEGIPPGSKFFELSAKEGGNLEAEKEVHQSATDEGTNVKSLPISGATYGKATLNFEGQLVAPDCGLWVLFENALRNTWHEIRVAPNDLTRVGNALVTTDPGVDFSMFTDGDRFRAYGPQGNAILGDYRVDGTPTATTIPIAGTLDDVSAEQTGITLYTRQLWNGQLDGSLCLEGLMQSGRYVLQKGVKVTKISRKSNAGILDWSFETLAQTHESSNASASDDPWASSGFTHALVGGPDGNSLLIIENDDARISSIYEMSTVVGNGGKRGQPDLAGGPTLIDMGIFELTGTLKARYHNELLDLSKPGSTFRMTFQDTALTGAVLFTSFPHCSFGKFNENDQAGSDFTMVDADFAATADETGRAVILEHLPAELPAP